MKALLKILTISILAISCTSLKTKEEMSSQISFDSMLNQYYEERLQLFPFEATFAGDDRYNDVLHNDISIEYRQRLRSFYEKYRDLLKQYDQTTLSEEEIMSHEILSWQCAIALESLQFDTHFMPINQFWSTPLLMGTLAGGSGAQPFKTVKDYDNWLSRLDGYVVWCDTAIANMKKGIAQGYVLPKILAERVVTQLAPFTSGAAEDHLFYQPVKNMPQEFSEADKERIKNAYADMITGKIIPAYQKLHTFIQNDYLPSCRATSGISDVPNGRELYNHLIKVYTTTDLSAEEIFEIGRSEVERITREMEAVKSQVGFKGTLKEFFVHLRNKKELMPFTQPEQVIEHFHAIHERMKPNLEKLFDKVPKTAFEVRRTEAFREASASAEYNQGSLDGTRPGIFYVPIPDVKKYNILSDEDLFLHEAIPGHHYQISLQQENDSLPKFRKTSWNSAYGEGWALYTESLGQELGLYTDPYQYLGMLSAEMHRAIRLVVDAGMHTQGWTREQAIQYSLEREAEDERSVTAEIERYMAIPAQALSYKVGQLKIRELRTKAERELGDTFNIAQFHNQILGSGSLPLSILEKKINAWIEEQKRLM